MTKVLIIEARYYEGISDSLLEGALAKLNAANVEIGQVTVPGALEIPVSYTHLTLPTKA